MTKDKDQLIEAMARASDPLAFVTGSPLQDVEGACAGAERALAALEAARPDIAAVLRSDPERENGEADMNDHKALPDLKAQAEELKCGVAATVDALIQRLDRAEHIIATVAVNCQKSRDPVLLVQYLAAIDYKCWLDTGVYTEPDIAPIPSGKTEEADARD